MDQVYFVLLNLLATLISATVASRLMAGRESWRKVLATLAGFPLTIVLALLALGAVGQITPAAASALLAAVAVALLVGCRLRPRARVEIQKGEAEEDVAPGRRHLLWLLATALFLTAALPVALHALLGPIHYTVDDLSYHATAPAHWLLDQSISLKPLNYHRYFPLNAELMALWFMLPFHSDAQVSLGSCYWTFLLAGAAMCLARAQGGRGTTTMLIGALVLSTPTILWQISSFSAADVAGSAALLAGISFLSPTRAAFDPRETSADALYAGLLVGLAVGARVVFLPSAAVLLLWLVFVRCRGASPASRGRLASLFVLGTLATGAYWYVRNLVLTGNPFFPAQLGPFEGPFDAVAQARTKLITWMAEGVTDLGLWEFVLRRLSDWPFGFFLVSFAGYAFILCAVATRRGAPNRWSRPSTLLLAVGTLLLVQYPFMPFSATENHPTALLTCYPRMLITPYVIGITLIAKLPETSGRWRVVLPTGLIILVFSVPSSLGYLERLLVMGLFVLLASKSGRTLFVSFVRRRWVPWCGLASALVALALLTSFKQLENDRSLYALRMPLASSWKTISALPPGSQVAYDGSQSWMYYPLFGRRLQHRPTPATNHRLGPLHEWWRREDFVWWGRTPAAAPPPHLVEELQSAGIDYVLVSKGNAWPPLQWLLSQSERAEPIYYDAEAMIWRLQ